MMEQNKPLSEIAKGAKVIRQAAELVADFEKLLAAWDEVPDSPFFAALKQTVRQQILQMLDEHLPEIK